MLIFYTKLTILKKPIKKIVFNQSSKFFERWLHWPVENRLRDRLFKQNRISRKYGKLFAKFKMIVCLCWFYVDFYVTCYIYFFVKICVKVAQIIFFFLIVKKRMNINNNLIVNIKFWFLRASLRWNVRRTDLVVRKRAMRRPKI